MVAMLQLVYVKEGSLGLNLWWSCGALMKCV